MISISQPRLGEKPGKLLAMALAALLGFTMIGLFPSMAAHADTDSSNLKIDPYLVDSQYKGVAVDIRVLDIGLTDLADLTGVRVIMHRTVGGDVVKVSTSGSGVLAALKAGNGVTAPIVIQQGTYDEAGSSSWVQPDAVWTHETVPIGVTVELIGDAGIIISGTFDAPFGRDWLTFEDILPAAPPTIGELTATYWNDSDYAGISVTIPVSNFTDAEQLIVRVDRENGPSVHKSARQSLLDSINAGDDSTVDARIVIQPGTYDEAGDTDWNKPGAVWSPTSIPTSVTVTITRADGPDVVATAPISGSAVGVLPAASTRVVLELPADQSHFEVSTPEGAVDVALRLGDTNANGEVTVTHDITVLSATGTTLTIPSGTTFTASDPSWDGVITLPTVKQNVVVPAPSSGHTSTVSLAIEVGSDTARLDFDAPVKLVLAGQAGKKAGFVQSGTFHAIDTLCSSASPALRAGEECWLDEGDDLVIWTTHFTTFVAYSTGLANTGVGDLVAPIGYAGALVLLGVGVMVLVRVRRNEKSPRATA